MVEIAKVFKVAQSTVKKSLEEAAKSGIIDKIEKMEGDLISDLVPLALAVYTDKLTNEKDVFVAKDVIDKMVKLGDRHSNKNQSDKRLGLEAYIAAKKLERERHEADVKEKYSKSPIIEATTIEPEQIAETSVGEDSE